LELISEIEPQVERERNARARLGPAALLADDDDVVGELGQAVLLELEIAAVGAQLARERDAFLLQARLAASRNHQAQVRALEEAELLGAPREPRPALLEAKRQHAARGEAALAALDGKLGDAQRVALEHGAQLPVLEEHAIGRQVERDRVAAQRAGEARLAERAAAAPR